MASGTIDDLLLKASQQLERSSEEPVQQATMQEMLVEASQLLQELKPETTQLMTYSYRLPCSLRGCLWFLACVIWSSSVLKYQVSHVSKATGI